MSEARQADTQRSPSGAALRSASGAATRARRARRPLLRMLLAVLLVLAVAVPAGVFGVQAYRQHTAEQATASIRTAVLNAAMQCAAVEGAYPQTLQYLEDQYGLVINHDKYFVSYEAFASNIVPSVVVRLK